MTELKKFVAADGNTCVSFIIIYHNGMNTEIIRPIWSEKHYEKTAGSARFRHGAKQCLNCTLTKATAAMRQEDPTAVKPIALKKGRSDITGEGGCCVLCARDGGCTELRATDRARQAHYVTFCQ